MALLSEEEQVHCLAYLLKAQDCADCHHLKQQQFTFHAGAAKALQPEGYLLVYGPFKQGGQHTSESNAAFDASLQQQNSHWGYRCACQPAP